MYKAAIVVLADTETPADLSRLVNALTATKEFMDSEDEVTVVFDGAGTKWIPELSRPEHKYQELFEAVKGSIDGACAYCAKTFGVTEEVRTTGVPLVGDVDRHPSLRSLTTKGYEVITF